MITNENKFGILGYGYVGKATHLGLLKNKPAVIHDKIFDSSINDLSSVDTVFVCLPTADKSDIETLIKEIRYLKEINPSCQIVIRSTLPIGTSTSIEKTLSIPIIYIPEFLRERYWEEDCQRRPIIVGTNDRKVPNWLIDEDIEICSLNEAETVKMFSNNFAVVRIAFANLFYDISQEIGADYDRIKEMFFKIVHDQTYMEVPGHDGTRGFGGKCLPKDLDFMIDSLEQQNLDSSWLKNIRELNKEWQKKF